jgi:hypothetical protein
MIGVDFNSDLEQSVLVLATSSKFMNANLTFIETGINPWTNL